MTGMLFHPADLVLSKINNPNKVQICTDNTALLARPKWLNQRYLACSRKFMMRGFEIAEANIGDIDALADVHESSLQCDWIYCRMFRDVHPAAIREFSRALISRRLNSSHSKIFKVTNESTQ